MNNRECQTDIFGNSLSIKWVMITAPLAILAGFGKFGDLVDRIVGSNSKIGNFTILKVLFSHKHAKKVNRKLTITPNDVCGCEITSGTEGEQACEILTGSGFHETGLFGTRLELPIITDRRAPSFFKKIRSRKFTIPATHPSFKAPAGK